VTGSADKRPARVRITHWLDERGGHLLGPVLRFDRLKWLRFMPTVPRLRSRGAATVWPDTRAWRTPEALRTVAGIWRDARAEEEAFRTAPLHDFTIAHMEPSSYAMAYGWRFLLPSTGPRLVRALRHLTTVVGREPAAALVAADPAETAHRIKDEAAQLGFSAIGFAPHDDKYTFVERTGRHEHQTVIVCVLEQDWKATQTAPSVRAERSAFAAYGEIVAKMAGLAAFIQRLGYEVCTQGVAGEGVSIHYGVQAGLGQLGLNGQLLTPMAGSRVRLMLLTSNAPVVFDEPMDYGIHTICDACQACVRRCPVGAIPIRRTEYRGVTKAKIKTDRCFPVTARVHGCAVCMKVCPVQRYGLAAVTDHLERTGSILGKSSDELEGYHWPVDGRYYGPASKPPVTPELLKPPGWRWTFPDQSQSAATSRGKAASEGDGDGL
jgi:ferredoxin